MKKILFADLFGTLISVDKSDTKKYFGSLDKECEYICQYLNEFLRVGNEIVIVSNAGGHGLSVEPILQNEFTKLNSYILENLRSHLMFYLIFNRNMSENSKVSKKNMNGKTYYVGCHPFPVVSVDKKEDAIHDFLSTMEKPYQIFGIGDSEKDIPMLLRIQEMGGISSFIDTSLYRINKSTHEIIEDEIQAEYNFLLENEFRKQREEKHSSEVFTERERVLLEKLTKRRQELYVLLSEGKLDLDSLKKNYSKYVELSHYQISFEFAKRDWFWENYPFDDQVVQKVMDMPCYSSFVEYYSRVLKKE